NELVARIERRRMTHRAALRFEDAPARLALCAGFVRVWRRFERVDVQGQCVELFIAESAECRWIWQFAEVDSSGDEVTVPAISLYTIVAGHRRVSHDVANRAVQMQACVIEVLAILDAGQVRHLDRELRLASPANCCTSPRGACEGAHREIGIGIEPWEGEPL